MPPTPPRPASAAAPAAVRPWYMDGLCALAFFALALLLGKTISRALGPIAGLFFFAITAGLGWFYAKAAWRGLLQARG